MDFKNLLKAIGFSPKENVSNVFAKKYSQADNYCLEVDFEKGTINYGNLIRFNSKTTQNFFQSENWVVLECVNRLLEKGYKPVHIILEKTYPAGHGTSGRLDICVTREDGSEYLLIECKAYRKEFDKELARMKKDGGQLFTYFKFSNKADILLLYTSEWINNEMVYRNEIVRIEDDYRTGDVKDFHERWNKLTKDNGVFDSWVRPYHFESKALIPENLKEIKPEDSSLIFNQFLEILRHHVVSDKPNAFNKIFTLFLCKILDEKNTKPNEELAFQWFYTPYQYEGISYPPDNPVSFQKRLTDLYKKGMKEFLEKEVTDISDAAFGKKYEYLEEEVRRQLLDDLTEIRLKKNNEFAIKEVFDNDSFEENAKVVKEVVELLQGYKIRYAAKQQYLSDFFELLLTTGLKQESGQYFTPVPVAQFIIKSLPIDAMANAKMQKGINDEFLPYIIDYASGSGHFVTESMHLLQQILHNLDTGKLYGEAKKFADKAKGFPYDWAIHYVYGIEKDYRLVKVGKVGCYLHGDGLAQVIHSDGLGNFKNTKEYKGLLTKTDKDFPMENKQFDILVSNPPYSVSAFKNNASKFYGKDDFELYNSLTDSSSEIECLFVERAKQLLKDGGVAGIILPSSILSNEGIYTKTREIILQYFELVAITELGNNTFMATGTNTVVLFLRRRNNYDSIHLRKSVERFFEDFQDVTRNGIERPVSKYLNHVWEGIPLDDYVALLKKAPNKAVIHHEIYKEYKNKIKSKTEKEFWNVLIDTEKEKLYYFILAYPQKVVWVKTGEKEAEKRFLGYEFSNRRGSEGIHPIQRGKTISECTQLFDDNLFDNPEKASTYIYKAFENDYDFPICESLKNNISRLRLVDMLTFDRAGFTKNISTAVKKKVTIESKWENKKIAEIVSVLESGKRPKGGVSEYRTGIPSLGGEHINMDGTVTVENMKFVPENYFNQAQQGVLTDLDILICKDGALTGKTALFKKTQFPFEKGMINEHVFILRTNELCLQLYLFNLLFSPKGQELLKLNVTGTAQGGLNRENLLNIPIPLPPKAIQEKIVREIEVLEQKETEAKRVIEKLKQQLHTVLESKFIDEYKAGTVLTLEYGSALPESNRIQGEYPVMGSNGRVGFHNKYLVESPSIIVGRKGSAGKITWMDKNCYPIDTTFYVKLREIQFHLKLIYYALQRLNLESLAGGTGVPGLNRNEVYSKILFLPPLSDQQPIVAEIEKIEMQMAEAQKIIHEIPELKNETLKKYL